MRHANRFFPVLLLSLMLGLLLACGEEEPTPAPTTIAATATARPTEAPPTVTQTPSPTPSPTPTIEPSPLLPSLLLSDQTLTESGELVIDRVVSPGPAWVNVYTGGVEGMLLGQIALPAGSSEDVVVNIDPYLATATLNVELFQDLGEIGRFAADEDLPLGVTQSVAVTLDVPLPSIVVSEQSINEAGFLLIDAVIAVDDGWLAIFTDAAGAPDQLLAFTAVSAGLNEALPLTINRYEATTTLHAVLYTDAGEMGRFEPLVDPPVLVAGALIDGVFDVTLPLDIYVYDQLPFDGQIVIERVVVPIDAFVAVYFDEAGGLGRVIGFAPLAAGVNENVVIDVQASLVTPIVYLAIHQDVAEPGVFDFPGEDSLLAIDGQIPAAYSLRTNPGNYFLTQDQPLADDGTILVPLIMVDNPAWVVVYEDDGGELGEIVGVTGIPAGFHRDIAVSLESAEAGATYHIVLHIDNAEIGEFDRPTVANPTGPDIPFQRNRRVIRAPFTLLDT